MAAVNEFAKEYRFDLHPRTQAWTSEQRTRRNAIYRDCPNNLVVDREHALARVSGTMTAGHGAYMTRRYLIRGLLGDGFTAADVAQALRASDEEMANAQGELPISEPHARRLKEWREQMLPTQSNDPLRARSMPNTEQREGNLIRGSRGWRTPPESFPQTTTPPHA